ncbi:hypothetical protein GCM10017620_08550 [Brevundimonas intermedia]|uniref:Yip1 domain-containing protein n=1 Tax=Brevundimonas intermedia TaxID=74315 RepID=A0ABQ5T5N0_9CAUL|nr:hypothetical protein [Brevundimonas intermedia]GLK47882.1 hypothetical protein GCM10017620_08550 [Brevundimonas intermedia]
MTRSTIDLWLRAMNPLILPRGMAEAQRSARAMVVGLGIALVVSLVPTWWMFTSGWFETAMNDEYARMNLSSDQIATQRAVMKAMWPFMVGFGAIFSVLLYGVLAAVQWRMMTRVIPIIMLAMIAYSLVANVGMRLLGSMPTPELPLWILAVVWPASVVSTVIYVASLQGAMLLHRLRREP